MQQATRRSSRARSPIWYIAAGLALAVGVLAAVLLPHSCGEVASACAPPRLADCGRHCTGVGVMPRVLIALAGLAVASLLMLLGLGPQAHTVTGRWAASREEGQ
jgi:hypothetical protein